MSHPQVKTVVTCAGCGVQRKEANHWFILERVATGPVLYTVWRMDAPTDEFLRDLSEHSVPVCGEQCLHRIGSKIIAGEV